MPKLTNGLNQPECPKCGPAMMLTPVGPDEAGLKRRSLNAPCATFSSGGTRQFGCTTL